MEIESAPQRNGLRIPQGSDFADPPAIARHERAGLTQTHTDSHRLKDKGGGRTETEKAEEWAR